MQFKTFVVLALVLKFVASSDEVTVTSGSPCLKSQPFAVGMHSIQIGGAYFKQESDWFQACSQPIESAAGNVVECADNTVKLGRNSFSLSFGLCNSLACWKTTDGSSLSDQTEIDLSEIYVAKTSVSSGLSVNVNYKLSHHLPIEGNEEYSIELSFEGDTTGIGLVVANVYHSQDSILAKHSIQRQNYLQYDIAPTACDAPMEITVIGDDSLTLGSSVITFPARSCYTQQKGVEFNDVQNSCFGCALNSGDTKLDFDSAKSFCEGFKFVDGSVEHTYALPQIDSPDVVAMLFRYAKDNDKNPGFTGYAKIDGVWQWPDGNTDINPNVLNTSYFDPDDESFLCSTVYFWETGANAELADMFLYSEDCSATPSPAVCIVRPNVPNPVIEEGTLSAS